MKRRLTNLFTHQPLSLKQSDSGIWMVKRKFNIVYMGSKDKCEMYLSLLRAA